MRKAAMLKTVLALMVVLGFTLGAIAASNPSKTTRRCRNAIAGATSRLVSAGLKSIDACHKKRDTGKFTGDCNTLAGASAYSFAETRATAGIGAACTPGNPALHNYPDGRVADALLPAVRDLLESNAQEVQGQPDIVGDKQKVKCHKSIGTARSLVVRTIVWASARCPRSRDKKASTVGASAPDCIAGSGSAGTRATGIITKACSGMSGLALGSCDGLADCVIQSATETGQDVARDIYGGGVCGNGERELGEDCDDGNTSDADDCTSQCHRARCGDGIVRTGVEQCDDGNDDPADGCRNDCTLPVCGDGIVAAGIEECDDGNDVPHDGCTSCEIDAQACGTDGLIATVALSFDEGLLLAGFQLDLGYPAPALSLPGSGSDASVGQRVTDVSNAGGFLVANDRDANSDGTDDTLRTTYATAATVPPAAFEKIRFDCQTGAMIRPRDFTCAVSDPADQFGNPIGDPIACSASVEVVNPTPTTTLPTITTSTSSSVTTTTSNVTTTSTTMGSGVCGNGTVEAGETCDDGNTLDGDACPSNCRIETCTPVLGSNRTFSVTYSASGDLAGIKVLVNYPEGQVSIPGSGNDSSVRSHITNLPSGAFSTPNDLDYALREVVASASALPPGRLFTINFQDCQGASPPSPAGFTCTVEDATDPFGNTVTDATCTVTSP